MKYLLLLSIFSFATLFAQEQKRAKSGDYQTTLSFKDIAEKDPAVKAAYEKCKAQTNPSLLDCVWGALPPDEQERVRTTYFKKDSLQAPSAPITTNNRKTKAEEELEKFFYDKLQTYLFSEAKDQGNKVVEQQSFIQLYKTEVSKEIVTALTSFCVEADSSLCISDKADIRKSTREGHLKDPTASIAHWNKCIASVTDICHDASKSTCTSSRDETKKRACEVTNYIRGLRQVLIKSEKIDKEMEAELQVGHAMSGYDGVNAAKVEGKKISEITVTTSADLKKYETTVKAQAADLEALCNKTPDDKRCVELTLTQEESSKLEGAGLERDLKQKALEDRLSKLKGEELKKALEEHLKDEGRDESEIKKMLTSDEEIDKIKSSIISQFQTEREELEKSLKDRLKSKTATDPEKSQTAQQQVIEEMKSNPERLRQIIAFDNIVSSYLTVTDANQKNPTQPSGSTQTMAVSSNGAALNPASSTNSAAMREELKSKEGVLSEASQKTLKEEASKIPESKEAPVTLDVKELNEKILKISP